MKKVGSDASQITNDYIRNSSLLINLAKSIGKLLASSFDAAARASESAPPETPIHTLEFGSNFSNQIRTALRSSSSAGVLVLTWGTL